MDFFPTPTPAPPAPQPPPAPSPEWAGPPEDVLPGSAAVELLLGRSATTAVFLTGVRAYPTGLAFTLGVRYRGPDREVNLNDEVFEHRRRALTPEDQAARLRWGLETADGRRATNLDDRVPWSGPGEGAEPDHPVLTGRGGGGSGTSLERGYWLWPLPPAGRLRLVCQWSAHGIALTDQEIDAGPLRDAAARARPLWD